MEIIQKLFMLSYFLPLALLVGGFYTLICYKAIDKIASILFFNAASLSFWVNTLLAKILKISVFNVPTLITFAVISIILFILFIVMVIIFRGYEKHENTKA